MIIDGEKWACEACVRGHRVSNCQHSDRPLQHINKKGRPVSQCQHCRAMRKSRASHVKCDCGEKTHKCVHLKATVEGHKDSCCCNHGGRCTCSHKEQPQLDTVPESDSDQENASTSKSSKGQARPRRRANTTHSDTRLAFDDNGHHRPTYKHAKASQKCGPYQLNRVNSLHSTSSLGNRSVENLVHGSSTGEPGSGNSPISSNGVTQERRKVRSEAASPLMTSSSFTQLNAQLAPLDLSAIEFPPYVPNSADFFGNCSDHEPPIFSAGLSAASVDWSHYDGLEFASSKAPEFAPSSYSQPQSLGLDFSGSEHLPTLTTNTSTPGEVSEAEDFLPASLDDFDANSGFRNSTASSGFNLTAMQANLLSSTDLSTLDYEQFKFMKADNKFLPAPASLPGDEPTLVPAGPAGVSGFSLEEDPAFWMDNYAHGLPNLTDSPASSMPSFWDAQ